MHLLLTGYPPFTGRSDEEIIYRIKAGKYSLKAVEWKQFSNECKSLISRMLEYNPNKRLTAQQCLDDVWFKKQSRIQGIGKIITIDCINNLRSFCSEQKLQSAVISFIQNKEESLKKNDSLRKIFEEFDENGDGMLQRSELLEGYTKLYGSEEVALIELEKIEMRLNLKNIVEIDYKEFLKSNLNQYYEVTDQKLKAAFNLFDIDGSGTITLEEIQYLLGGQEDVEAEIWIDLVKTCDLDGDGEITYEEFPKMMYVMYLSKCG